MSKNEPLRTLTEIQARMLAAIAERAGKGMWNTIWQNCEAEWIAVQTLAACWLNYQAHGECLSWLARSCTTGRDRAGTDNARGLQKVIDSGHIVREQYDGELTPEEPERIVERGGKYDVLRITDNMLTYAVSNMKIPTKEYDGEHTETTTA